MPAAQRPTWVWARCPPMSCCSWACSATSATATSWPPWPRCLASALRGPTLLWSRGRSLEGADDFVTPVRRAFSAAGFAELSTRSFDVEDDHTALGVVRFDGPSVPLGRRETWFTFVG